MKIKNIKTNVFTSLKLMLFFVVLLGVIYPAGITGISMVLMKDKAGGSIVYKDNMAVGSKLIAQEFTEDKYFHSRPGVEGEGEILISGASNLSITNKLLLEKIQERKAKAEALEEVKDGMEKIPNDMVMASASGIDPHISIENAMLQAKRIGKARGVERQKIVDIINKNKETPYMGFMGVEKVNVLMLNLELDKQLQ